MSSFEIAIWVTWNSLPILPSIFGLSSQNIMIPHYPCYSVAKLLFLNFYSFCLKYFLDESFLKRSLPFPRKEAAISALYTFFFFVEFFLRKGPQFQLTFLINFFSKRTTYISHQHIRRLRLNYHFYCHQA